MDLQRRLATQDIRRYVRNLNFGPCAAAPCARDALFWSPPYVAPPFAGRLGVERDIVLRELTRLVDEQCSRLGDPDGDFMREP